MIHHAPSTSRDKDLHNADDAKRAFGYSEG